MRRRPRSGAEQGAGRDPGPAKKALSALEIGLDLLLQVLEREGARLLLTVDEEGGCGIHAELRGGDLAGLFDVFEQLLIRQALLEALLGEAGLLGDGEQGWQRLLHRPGLLLAEQRLHHGEEFSL